MFIERPAKPVRWADRTMSVLQRNRFQACEKNLAGLPQHTLFDPSVTDVDAEMFYASSWYSMDEKPKSLHTIEALRARVLEDLAVEMALLAPEEHDLMIRAVLCGGHLPLLHPESLFPAVSLVRRLWARVIRGPRFMVLELPTQVCLAGVLTMAGDGHQQLYDRFANIFNTVDNTLYLAGVLNADTVLQDMREAFRDTPAADRLPLYRIALRAGFDTFVDTDGILFLVHPGLAEPHFLLSHRHLTSDFLPVARNAEDLTAAYESLTELEDPMYDHLLGLITGLTRPEISAEDVVEDLIILIKQGAPVPALLEVLSSHLVCYPSAEMKSVLEEMYHRIPRWLSLNMGRLQ